MELREYWRIVRRRAWIPAVLLAATILAAGTLALLAKPEYTATATVDVRGNGILSFPEVVGSNTLSDRVVHQLGLSESPDQLKNQLHVSAGRTNLYRVSITDPDPARATAIANAAGKQATALYLELANGSGNAAATPLSRDKTAFQNEYLTATQALLNFNRLHPDAASGHAKDVDVGAQAMQLQLEQQAAANAYLSFQAEVTRSRVQDLTNARNFSASFVDEATAQPDTVSRVLRVAYPAGLALALGIGIIFVLEYVDNSIREPEAAESLLGAPVIGIIPHGSERALRPARGGAA